MEDLVHDLPLPVDFKQREQVRVSVTGPVVEFEPHGGDRAGQVNSGAEHFEARRRPILVVPVEQALDGPGPLGVFDQRRWLVVLCRFGGGEIRKPWAKGPPASSFAASSGSTGPWHCRDLLGKRY